MSVDIYSATKPGDKAFRRMPNFVKEPEELETKYGRKELLSISRSLFRNEGIVKGAIELKATHSLTNAFTYKARHEEADLYNQYVNNWYKIACVDGTNFQNLLYQVSVAMDVDGDCFILLTKTNTGFPKLQLIRANRIHFDKDEYNGHKVIEGVVLNKQGREVGYILDGEKYLSSESVIHCKDVDYLSSVRGTPLFAHSMRNWRYYEDINESELHAAKIASQIALVEHNDTGGPEDDMNIYSNPAGPSNQTTIKDYGNGTIKYFQAASGSKLETMKFERPSINYLNFVKQLMLSSLAGVGIPYSLVVGNDGNSVAARVDLAKFDREIMSRYELLSEIAKKAIEYVIAVAIQRNDLPPVRGWWQMAFSRPPKASLNFSRDTAAEINLYKAGLRTLTEAADDKGMTLKEYLDERKNEYLAAKQISEQNDIPIQFIFPDFQEAEENK